MAEDQEDRGKTPPEEKLTARDGAVGAAHAAQLTHIGGPLAHTAVQAVGIADAAKVAVDLAQGKEVRAIDVAGAAASVTMSAGVGGPAVQLAAQGVALASGADAISRGSNTLQDSYDKAVAAPIAANVADRKDIEARHSPGNGDKKTTEERARADVVDLHGIDHEGERGKAIAAMARTAARDSGYNEAVKRLDPLAAESVALAIQQAKSSARDVSPPRETNEPVPAAVAQDWVARNLVSLRVIENDSGRRHFMVEMGDAAKDHPLYKAELQRQDPTVSTAVGLAYEMDQRRQADKEDRKASEMRSTLPADGAEQKAEDRLAHSLDKRMARSELEERGWRRDGIDDVMQDLMTLASRNWQRAADLWDKFRPNDTDKPSFIEGADAIAKRTASKEDNALDRGQKEADRGQPEPKETEFLTPESIRKRFIQAENKYFYREDENRLAFEDKGKRLATAHNDPEVARSMVELAEAKGWDALKVKGSEAFKRTVWLQASLRGMEVDGFVPKDVDLAKLEELKSEKGKTTNRSPTPERPPAQNVVEQTATRQRTAQPEQALDRTTVVDEHQQTLSKPQRQAVEALKAILRDRGDSEQAVNMAADVAAARFQNNRVHVGKILDHGQAPYEHNQANANSYYVKLQTERGEKEIWGVDLRRALGEGSAKVGDDVALSYQGRQKVTVPVAERDGQGKVTGRTEIAVDRNTWDVNRLDNVRDEVREALRAAANKTETRQPLMKVYDRSAPREELRPEPTREHARRNERTR